MFVIRNKKTLRLPFPQASARHYPQFRREEILNEIGGASFLTELPQEVCALGVCGSFAAPQSNVEVCLPGGAYSLFWLDIVGSMSACISLGGGFGRAPIYLRKKRQICSSRMRHRCSGGDDGSLYKFRPDLSSGASPFHICC